MCFKKIRKRYGLLMVLLNLNSITCLASEGYAGGSGTQTDPFLISTPQHLNQLQLDVNVNGVSTSGVYYRLINDIDLSEFDSDTDSDNGNWIPIGGRTGGGIFNGHFDGDGYQISNLVIRTNEGYVGLFGNAQFGSIKNLKLENVDIKGDVHVGGLVGIVRGLIENIDVSGRIEGKSYVGGVVGRLNLSTLKNSLNRATVVNGGGLVGHNYAGKIVTSLSIGEASCGVSCSMGSNGTFENSFWDMEASGTSESRDGVGLTTEQLMGNIAKESLIGFDFDSVWEITTSYPKLTLFSYIANPPIEESISITTTVKNQLKNEFPEIESLPVVDHLVKDELFLLGKDEDEFLLFVFSSDQKGKPLYGEVKENGINLNFKGEQISSIYINQGESRWKLESNAIALDDVELSNVLFSNRTILHQEGTQGVLRPANGLLGRQESVLSVGGHIHSAVLNLTVPTSTLEFKVNPNLSPEPTFVAPELTLINDSSLPLKLGVLAFEEITDIMNDVLPDYHSDWGNLTKAHAQDFSLGLFIDRSEGWGSVIEESYYVAQEGPSTIGVIKPFASVRLSFQALHSQSIVKTYHPIYRLVFDFGLKED